jgi:primosomal protein N' (replication factor Y)
MAERPRQEQGSLLDVVPAATKAAKPKVPKARTRAAKAVPIATDKPVGRVLLDTPLAHLDRPLDYLIPERDDVLAQPGVRVRVRLAGRLHDGFLIERVAESEHVGRLQSLERVVSGIPVLTPEIAALVRQVADRYAGTAADVLRAAVPPRHAATETLALPRPIPLVSAPAQSAWAAYQAGPALLARLADGTPQLPLPRAVWTALSGHHVDHLISLVSATASTGRSAVVVVPDIRDVSLLLPSFIDAFGADAVATLTADLGPAERYREFLRVLAGQARVVIGTRSAAFAPIVEPGLFVIWDDGDDLHVSPQAPFWHVRDVLALRALNTGAAFVAGAYARSVESQRLVETEWARSVTPQRDYQRGAAPIVRATGDDSSLERDPLARAARLPSLAWETARAGLAQGPVLVQVPRRGYLPSLACQRCRNLAQCPSCHGPLSTTSGHAAPTCNWCGKLAAFWVCPHCANDTLRAVRVGQRRTAEELGRAFPGTPVRTSAQGDIVERVSSDSALVIATPGAEPVADGGYAATILLDAAVLLSRPELRAAEESYRRWANAVALTRGADAGGVVVVVGESNDPVIQALVRHDAPGLASRELADRTAAGLPPAVRAVEIVSPASQIAGILEGLQLPPSAVVLGPAPVPVYASPAGKPDDSEPAARVLITTAFNQAEPLLRELQAVRAHRDLHKTPGRLTIKVDPVPFG